MKRSTIAAGAIASVLILLALAAALWIFKQDVGRRAVLPSPAIDASTGPVVSEVSRDLLYGCLTTNDGAAYEGWLRWGGDEEAFWGDYFNGFKDRNPWAAYVQPEQLKKSRPFKIFGLEIAHWKSRINLGRPFMARFGDIARIEADGRDLRVTLKSGSVVHLDRFAADDFADGIRVWDNRHGIVDFDEGQIRSIEFLHSDSLGAIPERLHGTVHTRHGDFTGFVQWDRKASLGSDELDGHTAGEFSVRFDTIRSIVRNSRDSALVTLIDGRTIMLSDTREVSHDNRRIYVDDRRYGRVLVSWEAFERVDFTHGGSGPAYSDFPLGLPLRGAVTTLTGRLIGRLVYDLDESETTDTLDAPSQGVNYNIPFGLISSIVFVGLGERDAHRALVTLHNGEELQLENTGDLSEGNAGMLIFADGPDRPDFVRWTDMVQVDFDRPPVMYPPLDER